MPKLTEMNLVVDTNVVIITSNTTDFNGAERLGITVSTPQSFYRNHVWS